MLLRAAKTFVMYMFICHWQQLLIFLISLLMLYTTFTHKNMFDAGRCNSCQPCLLSLLLFAVTGSSLDVCFYIRNYKENGKVGSKALKWVKKAVCEKNDLMSGGCGWGQI